MIPPALVPNSVRNQDIQLGIGRMDLNEGESNQTRRVTSINTSENIPDNNSHTRPVATFNYPSRPYGQHQKSYSEDEDADFNLEPAIKRKELTAMIMTNAKAIHIHRFRNLYVIMITMRCWSRKAPKGPLQHFRLILSYTDNVCYEEFGLLDSPRRGCCLERR